MIIGKGSAPGKVILMGEHSVVYGKPAIALPFFGVSCDVHLKSIEGPIRIMSSRYEGLLDEIPEDFEGIKNLIYYTLNYLKKEKSGLLFVIHSTIPISRGLGSSAAVSVALVRAIFDAYNMELDSELLSELVFVAESIHHSNPSGLDAITIINENFIVFQKDKPYEILRPQLKGFLVISDSNQIGNTKESVRNVKKNLKNDPSKYMDIVDELGKLAIKSISTIRNDDVTSLGAEMNKAHALLKDLGVSNAKLDKLVSVALKNGAIGAKLTGGGNGGCIIALTDSMVDAKMVSDALIEEGVSHNWIYNLKEVW
ncbi:MAG: mevalonate kinase [Erysipelothrix sp.]|nr:mevalonate kinase [Erysipelothrix sp.]